MYLTSFTAHGFRSLEHVEDIPVSKPTILAGHNDGGKSAVLDALAFLLGKYQLADEDRTYARDAGGVGSRCEETWVEGSFRLDADEQSVSGLPPVLQVRRKAPANEAACWEYHGTQSENPSLQGLDKLNKTALNSLVKEFGLTPPGTLVDDLKTALKEFAATTHQVAAWMPLPKELVERMPKLLPFGGKDESADDAVRTALNACYDSYLEDDTLQGRIRDIEEEIVGRLEKEADSLCQHIRQHCKEFVGVEVKPEVSFKGGFRRAPLHVSKADGEPVDLTRSGLGSNRRIALAIWEWTSNLLKNQEVTAAQVPAEPEPVQAIVVYDEPDTHLDYSHQRTVMSIIRGQCALDHVSVVVATHSMNLIDGVDIADVVHLKLSDQGRTMVDRLTNDSHDGIDFHLREISSAVGLRNSVLLHERCFLAVEGSTEQESIPYLFRLSQGLSLQAAGIALWACGNNEGALNLAGYLVKHKRSVLLMIDADSTTNKLFKEDRLVQAGLDLDKQVAYVGQAEGFNEFEELFTDDQWVHAANIHWPRADRAWESGDFAAYRQGKFSSEIVKMIKREAAEKSPNGKPDMVYALATTLTTADEVPASLRKIFIRAQAMASSENSVYDAAASES